MSEKYNLNKLIDFVILSLWLVGWLTKHTETVNGQRALEATSVTSLEKNEPTLSDFGETNKYCHRCKELV